MERRHGRVPVLYLAPWVDIGGSDKGTVDWFRFLDRGRFAASLITTQPSSNRRLGEISGYAEEVWDLPLLMRGNDFPRFIFAFLESRRTELVHIMNSRLAFDLLPVMASLPDRPRVVVQLHVEEPGGSRYVRYVTTRYGNLVDAFSLSTEDLSERLEAYDVSPAKRRVIRTGVDARHEFCPDRVTPIKVLDHERLQIVFPARLTAQKDPLLMVEVAARLRAIGVSFHVHVLGDGELADAVRDRVASLGLEGEVTMHGESLEVARWYAACDVALLTSEFEGLPYVAYEAMAMATPIVAPQLPGLDELVTASTGVLVGSRDAESFAAAIAQLAGDAGGRRRMGEAARARVLSQFSLERMTAEHAALYEELLAHKRRHPSGRSDTDESGRQSGGPPAALRGRRPGSRPLVSVIVPCFNHGRYLEECLASVQLQPYPEVETIVVDDGSTDPDTLAALDEVERERTALVVRSATNRGPGSARNAGVEHARGRYVLPLDADNLLLPTAVGDLVEQLNNAGEQIGFIYPSLQFFGNRQDCLEAPPYNLDVLLSGNFCDTASLIDREVFDRGLRYTDGTALIHEDWEFVLTLAEHGIYGEPASKRTLLVRKSGFTRNDLVNLSSRFDDVASRHPKLFSDRGRIKAEWNPGLSVLVLDPIAEDRGRELSDLLANARRQTCSDFELVIRTEDEVLPTTPRLRRVASALASSTAQALAQGVALAKGKYLLALYGSASTLLGDRTIVEKLLRVLEGGANLAAVVLVDTGEGQRVLRLLDPSEVDGTILGAVCWRATGPGSPSASMPLPADSPLETLASALTCDAPAQCRHFPRSDLRSEAELHERQDRTVVRSRREAIELGQPRRLGSNGRPRTDTPVLLPDCSGPVAAMLGSPDPWTPPRSRILCRHLHPASGRYIYTHSPHSPPECTSAHVLGVLCDLPHPGTTAINVSPDGGLVFGGATSLEDPSFLGCAEQFQLPLLDRLSAGRVPQTGQRVLIAGESDPLAGALEDVASVAFIEPYPIHPEHAPHIQACWGVVGLVRTVDTKLRRHRYGVGRVPPGVLAGELGALLREPSGDCEPLWIDDRGFVFALREALSNGRLSVTTALRWTGAPLTWNNSSRLAPRLRASARRAYDATRLLAASSPIRDRPAEPAGYLLRSPTPYTVPLYGALHPVTEDQLLTTSGSEASRLGYRDARLLGHLVAQAPVTGQLGPLRPAAPWANRFGVLTGV